MREPEYMCPALNRILDYSNRAWARTSDPKIRREMEKIEREVEKLRTRISNLREWGQDYKDRFQNEKSK